MGLAIIAIASHAGTRFDTPVAHVAARCCQQEQDQSEGQLTQHMLPAAQELDASFTQNTSTCVMLHAKGSCDLIRHFTVG